MRIKHYILIFVCITTLVLVLFGFRKYTDRGSGYRENRPNRLPRGKVDSITPELKARLESVYSSMNGLVQFHGKVVDQNGSPVGNSQILYRTVTAQNLGPLATSKHGAEQETTSDENGLFNIDSGQGTSLHISTIKKEGFRLAQDGNSLSYSFGSSSDPHRPDPNRPVEFMVISLANKPLERLSRKVLQIKWNSEPIEVPFGVGEILLIKSSRDKKVGEKSGFTWNIEIGVKNGGILFKDKADRLPLAPTDGYQEFVKFGSERSNLKWTGGMTDARLIFKTSQGLYGKIKLNLYVTEDDGQNTGSVIFYLNPTGGRFLN